MAREIERGVVATAGPRYFGYVIGGALPATVAADWLTTIWDQCAGLGALGPSASVVEEIVGDWLKEILGLPRDASFAITTGCQMAHVTALAAARHDVLAARGWDVRERGLAGSPPITVVVGQRRTRHRRSRVAAPRDRRCATRRRRTRTSTGGCGRRHCGAARRQLDGPTIVCAQAGEVNTGSFDPLAEIVDIVARGRRLAPRRRRVRPVGGGEPDAATSGGRASTAPTRGRPTGTSG